MACLRDSAYRGKATGIRSRAPPQRVCQPGAPIGARVMVMVRLRVRVMVRVIVRLRFRLRLAP